MKTLRHLSLLIIFCCAFSSSRAQYVTIPDTNFVSWLQFNYPTCMNGNQMDTTCNDIILPQALYINGKSIQDLDGVQYFDSLIILDCSNNLLTYLPPLNKSLRFLMAGTNQLKTLPALPDSLFTLQVYYNQLDSLPALPLLLSGLDCANNRLTTLSALPQSLRSLDCSLNQLTALPALPDSMLNLSIEYNNIDTLLPLPPGLITLSTSSTAVRTIPALPATLESLLVTNCPINSIPVLPAGLKYLNTNLNHLTSLPTLPAGLLQLSCSHNNLTALPGLPAGLQFLNCQTNSLTTLPTLPRTLTYLWCPENALTSIPELPDSLSEFNCSNNPNLTCLPRLTHIGHLFWGNTAVVCLPNYGVIWQSTPALSTKPLCTPGNVNGCQTYWNLSGTVYNDSTGDCAQQTGETNVPYLKVNLSQGGNVVQQTYTAGYGIYTFENDTGNYTIDVDTSGLPFNITCPANGTHSATITALNSQQTYNFALQCKPGYDIAVQSVSSKTLFRPAAFNLVQIKAGDAARFYKQSCNTVGLAGRLVTVISGALKYVAPAYNALTPTSVAGDTLTYAIADWAAVNPDSAFNIITQTDTTAQGGTYACFNASATPKAGDNDSANNTLNFCFPVVNSFDPNDKAVYPVSNVDITGDHWLTYTVRFQNTGNAPAEHIYITDTIDTDVDIETFQLLAYSFAPQVIIKGNAVRFNFANINLPDSVNDEPNSHGYVQYKVKVKDNATVGTVINNTAFIYFDFNAPVVTNTTTNTLALPNSITTIANSTATMQLYPNPAQDIVMINLSDNLTGGSLVLSDVTGRSLSTISITSTHNQLNTGALSSGVYLVTAVKGGVRVVQRLAISQ